MTLLPTVSQPSIEFRLETYEQAKAFQANLVWKKLDEITLEEVFSNWFSTLSHNTQINYKSGIRKLIEFGLINPMMTLQAFAITNYEAIIDRIKLIPVASCMYTHTYLLRAFSASSYPSSNLFLYLNESLGSIVR